MVRGVGGTMPPHRVAKGTTTHTDKGVALARGGGGGVAPGPPHPSALPLVSVPGPQNSVLCHAHAPEDWDNSSALLCSNLLDRGVRCDVGFSPSSTRSGLAISWTTWTGWPIPVVEQSGPERSKSPQPLMDFI